MKFWLPLVAAVLLTSASIATAQTDTVQKGEYLARAGDCIACHSTADGQPFAGGLKMGTPLGNIYTTNITPDRETGIGNYSLADFDRALRRGVAKDGRRLYPAMPYPSYAKVTDEDIAALYAFFMKGVAPVRQQNRASEISWPWNMRWPMAVWNFLFLDKAVYTQKPERDAVWNRGAYLVQGLGHCGACHTGRGWALQENALDETDRRFLAGATLDGWTAVSLRGGYNNGLGRWTAPDIVAFLRDGRNDFSTVFGSMLDAYNNSTQFLTEDDLKAVARYLKTLPGGSDPKPLWAFDGRTVEALGKRPLTIPGAASYLTRCAGCHGRDGRGQGKYLPPLAGHSTVLADDPSSVINIVLNGSGRVVTRDVADPLSMRPYRLLMNDREIADVVNFVRNAWGNQAPSVTAQDVATLRAASDMASDRVIVLRMR